MSLRRSLFAALAPLFAVTLSACGPQEQSKPTLAVTSNAVYIDAITQDKASILEGQAVTWGGNINYSDTSHGAPSKLTWDFGDGSPLDVLCDNAGATPCSIGGTSGYCALAGSTWTCPTGDVHVYTDSRGTGAGPSFAYSAVVRLDSATPPVPPTFTKSVTVNNVEPDTALNPTACNYNAVTNPFCNSGDSTILVEGATLDFAATSTDPGLDPSNKFVWDFGDGTVITCTSDSASNADCRAITPGAGSGSDAAVHVYAEQGTYTVTVRACDEEPAGSYNCDVTPASQSTVVIDSTPLVGSISSDASPSGPEGTTITFSASVQAPSPADTLTQCHWDFGDGTSTDDASCVGLGNGTTSAQHVYADNSLGYTVTLTVTDEDNSAPDQTFSQVVTNALPVVVAGTNQSLSEGDLVGILATFNDPGTNDSHTATIDWGDGSALDIGTVSEPPPSGAPGSTAGISGTVAGNHVYADNGVYTVTVSVTDDDGDTGTSSLQVTVANVAPTVGALSNTTINEGDTVTLPPATFHDQGTADTYTATINWGDGNTDPGTITASPFGPPGSTSGINGTVGGSHAYLRAGTYTVTVTVTDDDTGSGISSFTVTVNNVAPTVTVGAAQTGNEGDTITFSGTFTDPGTLDTWTCQWAYSDGTSDAPAPCTIAGGSTATHIFGDNGSYTATLTVTDDFAGSDSAAQAATISNVAPTANAGLDQTVTEGDMVSVLASFNDAGSLDTHTATIDWGDTTAADAGIVTETPLGPPGDPAGVSGTVGGSHVYADNGTYTVTVTVTDDDGDVVSDTLAVTVGNAIPTLVAGTDQTVAEGSTVSVLSNFHDQGTADTHTATIDWGDATAPDAGAVTESPFGPPGSQGSTSGLDGTIAGSHVYASNGDYLVTVTVTDDDLDTSSSTLTVHVTNVAPTVDAGADQNVAEGDMVNLAPATFHDASNTDTHTATIDWGDGTALDAGVVAETPASGPPGSTSGLDGTVSGSHVYADNGDYTVTVTVTDSDAASGSDTMIVHVANAAPVTVAGANQTVNEGDLVSLAPATFHDQGTLDTHTATISWGDGTALDAGVVSEIPFGPPGATTGLDGTVAGTHVYADDGVYLVIVTVTDDDGDSSADALLVTVNNVAPTVAAGPDQTVNEGDTVSIAPTFHDQGTGDTHTAIVDWGDGSAPNGGAVTESPNGPPGNTAGLDGSVADTHIYADNGDYTVTVTVNDDNGGSGSSTMVVHVQNVAPTLVAGANVTINEGDSISLPPSTFNDAGSLDSHTATLDWGDGSPAVNSTTGPDLAANGGFETGDLTGWSIGAGSVGTVGVVAAPVNSGTFSAQVGTSSGAEPGGDAKLEQTVTLPAGSGAMLDTWVDRFTTDSIIYDWQNIEIRDTSDNVLQTIMHVCDNSGGFVHVTANLSAYAGQTIKLVFLTHMDAFGDNTWMFVDDVKVISTPLAVVEAPNGPPGAAGGLNGTVTSISHPYYDVGTYTVTETLTDDDGAPVTSTFLVTVNNVPPQNVALSASQGTIAEGDSVDYTVTFTDPGSPGTETYDCLFTFSDDGSTQDVPGCSPSGATVTHHFADNGSWTVGVTVTDSNGGATPNSIAADVSDASPYTDFVSEDGPWDESTGDNFNSPNVASFDAEIFDGSSDGASDPIGACTWDPGDGSGTVTIPADTSFTPSATTTVTVGTGTGAVTLTAYCWPNAFGLGDGEAYFQHVYTDNNCTTRDVDGICTDPLTPWTTTLTLHDEDSDSQLADPNNFPTADLEIDNIGPYADAPSGAAVDPQTGLQYLRTNSPLPEGQFASLTFSWDDPSRELSYDYGSGALASPQDSFTVTIDWADSTPQTVINTSTEAISTSHLYTSFGTYNVTIHLTDDDGDVQDLATTIQVTQVPLEVKSVSTNAPVDENSPATVWVVANKNSADELVYSFDWDGDGLFSTPGVDVSAGSAAFSSYTRSDNLPKAGTPPLEGAQTITVRVDDLADGESAFGSVDVVWQNLPPVIDSAVPTGAVEGNPASLTVTAFDQSPDDLAAGLIVEPDWDGDGTYDGAIPTSIVGTAGVATLTHTFAVAGNYPVNVRVFDKDGDFSETTVFFTITHTNSAPVANDDSYTVAEDGTLLVGTASGVLANDTDSDSPSSGWTAHVVSGPANGTLTLFSDGSFQYQPNANYNGGDSFTYDVDDGMGGTSGTATVSITVTPVDDAPVAANDAFTTAEDTSLTIGAPGVLGNDTDLEGDTLTVSALVSGPAHGTLTGNPDGSFTYTPAADFNGTDTFSYTANDGSLDSNVATVVVNVTPVNDAPVANADDITTNEDTATDIDVINNDFDPDGDPVAVIADAAVSANGGSVFVNGDGTIHYVPAPNYSGDDTFTYHLNDGLLDSASATVTVHVLPVNDAPIAGNDAYSTAEDTPLTIAAPGVLGNDADVDSVALTAALDSPPAHGSVALNADGSFTYTPAADFSGTDTFTYQATDGAASSNVASVVITVTPVNDVPVASDGNVTTDEDQAITFALTATDADGDPLTWVLDTTPANGTLSGSAPNLTYTPNPNFNGTDTLTFHVNDGTADSNTATFTITVNSIDDVPVAQNGTMTVVEDSTAIDAPNTLDVSSLVSDADDATATLTISAVSQPLHGTVTANAAARTVTYVPAANFSGADSFTYTIADPSGATATATVNVTVTGVNDAPIAKDDSAITSEDTAVNIHVLADDSDPDGDPLTVAIATGPANGSVVVNPDQTVTYTPNADWNGTDTFTYVANDGTVDSAAATVTVLVRPVNDTPVATSSSITTAEDTAAAPVDLATLSSDVDVATNGDTLSYAVGNPAHGTASLAGTSVTYTPAPNFNGTDSFTWTVTDAAGAQATATVNVTVTPTNDAPALSVVLNPDPGAEAAPVTATFTIADVDGSSSGYRVDINWGDGSPAQAVTAAAPGAVNVAHTYADNGTYPVSATVTDEVTLPAGTSTGASLTSGPATATATIVNVAPSISAISASPDPVDENATVTVTVTASDVAGAADPLTYDFDFDGDGTYEISGASNSATHVFAQSGDYVVGTRVTDGDGGEAYRTLVVHVHDLAPSIATFVITPSTTINEGDTITATVTASDPAGDPLTYSWDFDGDGLYELSGQTSNTATHTYTRYGTFDVTVRVSDNAGNDVTSTQTVTVNNVAPSISAVAPQTAIEGHLYQLQLSANDPGAGETLTWSLVTAPAGMSISSTGTLGWVATYEQAGKVPVGQDHTVTVQVTDGLATDSVTFTVTALWRDDDGDGMADTWEIAHGMDPTRDDANEDLDGDGVSNYDEFNNDTGGPFTPSTLVAVAPTSGSIVFQVNDPTLEVTNPTDADTPSGITVVFELASSADFTSSTLVTAPVAEDTAGGATTTQVTIDNVINALVKPATGSDDDGANPFDVTLVDNTNYWWRARGVDSTGLKGPWSQAQKFLYNPYNDPPTAPLLASPLDTATVPTLTPTLITDNSSDLDDAMTSLTYDFQVFDNAGLTGTPVVDSGAVASGLYGSTKFVTPSLTENSWFWWRVIATDPHGATTTSATGSFFVNVGNNPPTPPTIVDPLDGTTVTTLTPTLTIGNSTDPDGATPLSYLFEIDQAPNFGSPAYQSAFLVDGSNGTAGFQGTTAWTPAALTENATYYWRVRAFDAYTSGDWSEGSFFVNTVNDPPAAPAIIGPTGGSLVAAGNVQLVVGNSADPDSTVVTYDFTVYSDENLSVVVTSGMNIAEGGSGQTKWVPGPKVKGGKRYWWTAVAHDDLGAASPVSETAAFQTVSVGGGNGCSCSTTQTDPASTAGAVACALIGGLVLAGVRRRRNGRGTPADDGNEADAS